MRPKAAAKVETRPAGIYTPVEIVEQWKKDGPLVRIATGIAPLDELCRGGLPIPWRVMIVGAPSAAKTGLATVIADSIARRASEAGLCVGILAVDEEPEDINVRLAQIAGFTVEQAEVRAPKTLVRMAEKLKPVRIRLYDASWTIEAAGMNLAAWAHREKRRAAFIIDSIQAASSNLGAEREAEWNSPRAIVEANVKAMRGVATEHRMLVAATSEANRASYRTNDGRGNETNDLAAGAESRAIEFGAQTQLMLRVVANGVIHVRVAKNRRALTGEFWLRLDRERHALTPCENPEPNAEDMVDARNEERRSQVERDAIALAKAVRAQPGLGSRDLRAAVRGLGWGSDRADAARVRLMKGIKGMKLVNRGKHERDCRWHVEQADGVPGVTGVPEEVPGTPGPSDGVPRVTPPLKGESRSHQLHEPPARMDLSANDDAARSADANGHVHPKEQSS